jgi:hypothetical protein
MKSLAKFLLVLLVAITFSCSKDDDYSVGEENAQKISQLIQDQSIDVIYVYERTVDSSEESWSLAMSLYNFEIESPYLRTDGSGYFNGSYYYDFNYLVKFNYIGTTLYLYFKY